MTQIFVISTSYTPEKKVEERAQGKKKTGGMRACVMCVICVKPYMCLVNLMTQRDAN